MKDIFCLRKMCMHSNISQKLKMWSPVTELRDWFDSHAQVFWLLVDDHLGVTTKGESYRAIIDLLFSFFPENPFL